MAELGPWAADRRVAVAVSGGADSLCLAWLASSWGRPFGLIVDHGLRAESAEEAWLTLRTLAGFGVNARILPLHGLAPGPGLAARARAARYAALTEVAAEAGLSDLLLGHHAGDQAETVLLRRERKSGESGLAGMPRIGTSPLLRFVRPLLTMPKARLQATLAVHGIAWADDPSNRNQDASRPRLRANIAEPGGCGPVTSSLVAGARQAGLRRAAREADIGQILGERVHIRPEGFALLSLGSIDPASLSALIRGLTGADYPARTASVERVAATPAPCVLGGLRIMPAGSLGTGWLLVREAAAMAPGVPAMPGTVWDRRFRLISNAPVPGGIVLGALGDDAARFRRLSALPAAVLQTLPALRFHGTLVAVPHIGYRDSSVAAEIRVVFSPQTSVRGAPFSI